MDLISLIYPDNKNNKIKSSTIISASTVIMMKNQCIISYSLVLFKYVGVLVAAGGEQYSFPLRKIKKIYLTGVLDCTNSSQVILSCMYSIVFNKISTQSPAFFALQGIKSKNLYLVLKTELPSCFKELLNHNFLKHLLNLNPLHYKGRNA